MYITNREITATSSNYSTPLQTIEDDDNHDEEEINLCKQPKIHISPKNIRFFYSKNFNYFAIVNLIMT